MRSHYLYSAIFASVAIVSNSSSAHAANAALRFNRDIRPIISENCIVCHGPDKGHRKAKLRLDDRDVALERKAFVPGKPNESELIKRIFSDDPDEKMPPPDSGKELSAAEKESLKTWIAQGAPYEAHWAYVPISRPEPPAVKKTSWVKNPIDAFVLAPLERRQIQPSGEADRGTLIRRLSLDLLGLPPTPAAVAHFANDTDANAYENLVDRLLNSPAFGERMAVPWLDVVRFADTVGYHGDQNVRIFPYRDYVIDSFNNNKPFDQFTIEQLAGDLLPNPTVEQRIATGFNRLNMMTREGGAQPGEYLAKYAADRVRTVSMAWLGSTMGCAECHDHKFDPFSAKDFYAMEAFFADLKQWGVYSDYSYTPNPDLKGWDNDHPFPPEVEVHSPYLEHRAEKLHSEMVELVSNAAASAPVDEWTHATKGFLREYPDGWIYPFPAETDSEPNDNIPRRLENGAILYPDLKEKQTIELRLPLPAGKLSMIRLELLPSKEHDGSILRSGDTATVALKASLARRDGKKASKLTFAFADADHKEIRYANGAEVIGVKDGWKLSKEHRKEAQAAIWLLDEPVDTAQGDSLVINLGQVPLGSVRLSISPVAVLDPVHSYPEAFASALKTDTRSPAQNELVDTAWFLSAAGDSKDLAPLHKLHHSWLECADGQAWSMVAEAIKPAITRVLARGNWQDETGEIVQPAAPHFLPQIKTASGERATRLDLARWIVSPENPLTSRTIMNRLWKQFFGTALATPVDDIGLQGEPPTHPELLDWLSAEFMESGWNIKHMVKLIVSSSTYRQTVNTRPEMTEKDPGNRLLASQNPRRLEAEFVRDNALFISGLLNLELGGPSVHPYQPPNYYVNLQFPDRDYYPDKDSRQYRRGLYMHWQRTFLHPMLANFDAPSREECTAYRVVSNTPQQALTLLNDPTFTEAARVLAERLLDGGLRSDEGILEDLYQLALARVPKESERASLKKFLQEQRSHYRADSDEATRLLSVGNSPVGKTADPAELAAWTEVCRVVLNLHETINTY